MTTLQDRVEDYASAAKKPKRQKPEWVPPTLDDFAAGSVLSFDQTVAKTGWARLSVYGDGTCHLFDKGIIKEPPVPDLKGHADTLQRAEWMCERICHVVSQWSIFDGAGLVVVHEMPAVQGYRIESSLMAALGVRQAATKFRLKVVMVSNQHMRTVLTPPDSDRSSKVPVRLALERYGLGTKSNADERDAMALALTYLYDRKKSL